MPVDQPMYHPESPPLVSIGEVIQGCTSTDQPIDTSMTGSACYWLLIGCLLDANMKIKN
jgi:hypothetical protein